MNALPASFSGWMLSAARLLTRRRIRAHAVLLALCLWGVCAADYATPGIFDRRGNIKFQDFLQFPVSAQLIAQGRARELYDDRVLAQEIRTIVGRDTDVYLQYFYGPQVALLFRPLAALPFLIQAGIWVAISLVIYAACVYLVWRRCSALRPDAVLVAICAVAYPPLFHFFVRGQLSAAVLLCFTAAYLALSRQKHFLAGLALGVLAFKPQFLVAIPLILLLARSWRAFSGLVVSALVQLGFASLYFGRTVMQGYFERLLHSAGHPGSTELIFSPAQMHSLHSFWEMLIPWQPAQWALYLISSFAVVAVATAVWKSDMPISIRFSALLLAAVLVNPHLYVYDLLALAPAVLLLADWSAARGNDEHPAALAVLLYLAFLLPLLGPLAYWTHFQLSVVVFAVLLWVLRKISRLEMATG